jgi:hypothetical protein
MEMLNLFAGFFAFAGALGELWLRLRKDRNRKNNEASAYFGQLGEAMEKVVEGLRANQIPRVNGHEMQFLIRSFSEKTAGIFTEKEASEAKTALDQAALIASMLDGWLLLNVPTLASEREKLLAEIERLAGDCRGLAGVLHESSQTG